MKRSEYESKMADLQNQIEELKKVKIEEDDERWRPSLNEKYYYVSGNGQIFREAWFDTVTSNTRYAIGNCFKTEEEAKFALERLKVLAELRGFAERDDTEDTEWNDGTRHYYIYYDFDCDAIGVDWVKSAVSAELYFATEERTERAIEAVGKDRIKKYYLRIKEKE